jgi:hypothetical protein
MKCHLTTNLAVKRVAVFAEMAWLERRPELGLLCRAAQAHDHRITTAVVRSTLPGLSDAGANNIIAWCKSLGLCDGRGALSELGEDVAEADEAPVPEQGVYGLWLAQHPLFGRRVLAVERLTSNRDQQFTDIKPLEIEPDRGKVFRSVLNSKDRFIVRDLPTNHGQSGGLVGETQATCSLRWTLDFEQAEDRWQLEGSMEAPQGNGKYAMHSIQHEAERDGLDLWNLASTWATGPLSPFGRWKPDERRLAVAFGGLAPAETETFRKDLKLPRADVPGKGTYENVTLEGVPIGPASAKDAQSWALARFDHHISKNPGYRSRTEIREQFAQLTEDTPLEAFSPTLPSHEDLLTQASKDPERFWSLAAPVDLAPFPTSPDELGPLRIGSQAPNVPKGMPGVVRVPYRGGWSMRKFIDNLLLGAAPRRVLLCDRYVRGDINLEALKLLVAGLRGMAPGVVIEVWTDDKEADFKKIQAILGSPPRSYRDMFGPNQPHDRYLLVLPSQGQGFGWQMTNSPLHARADVKGASPDTPLRWKDLAAIMLDAGDLKPALRQWLTGGGR